MTIAYRIQIGDPLSSEKEALVLSAIQDTFAHIDHTFNDWNPSSELSKLNGLKENEIALLSQELAGFLQRVDHYVSISEGLFDPTVAPLQTLWKEKLQIGLIPTQEEIDRIIPAIGWHHLHRQGLLAWKDHPLTEIDLGGVVKGHAVDLIIDKLSALGLESLYVEWGGEIRTKGKHPKGRPWQVAIASPETECIPLEDLAIATSGNYYQKWEVRGQTYTHIIDPNTYYPLLIEPRWISSTSVLAPSCAEADALATALMLFKTKEEALQWAKTKGLTVWVW